MERTINRLNLWPCQNILPRAGEEMWSLVRLLHIPPREEMTVAGPRWRPWRQRRRIHITSMVRDRTSLADFMPLGRQKRKTQTWPSGSSWSSGQRVGRGNAVEKSRSTALTQVSTRSSDSSAHPDVVPSDAITCSQAPSPVGQGKCCPALFDCHPGLPKEVTAVSCFPLKIF